MTEFQQNTEKMRRSLDRGDMAEICRKAGCVAGTLYSAWSKKEASELTDTELKAYTAFSETVADKLRERSRAEQNAAKLAEKLK